MGYDVFCMQARNINDELQRLIAALPDAIHRAAIALQTEPVQTHPAESEEEVDTLMKQIQQLIDAQERASAG
jgi:hypothetical protein